MKALVLAAYQFSIHPDQNAPGVKGITSATNEVAMYALLACGMGAVMSLLMLAAAKGLHLERLHTRGKEGVVVALIAAFAVGSIAAFLNAAYTLA
jgi:sugar diacid utilization regulator